PAFRNMRTGEPLAHFLDAKPVIHDLFGTEQIMSGKWISHILERHNEILDKLRRILFKSLGSLLCFQERVGENWKEKYAVAAQAGAAKEKAANGAVLNLEPVTPSKNSTAVMETGRVHAQAFVR